MMKFSQTDGFRSFKKLFVSSLLVVLALACSTKKTGPVGTGLGGSGNSGGVAILPGGHGNGGGGGTGGANDPGGGNFIYSSREDVIKSVNAVWKELTSSGNDNPILVAYLKLESTHEKSREQEHIFEMLKKILWGDEKSPDSISPAYGEFVETRLQQLKSKQPQFSDDCPASADDSMMSVTSFDFNGYVCVHLKNMMASSTSSSKHDIMALLVHEIAHLAGYKHQKGSVASDDLKRIQRFFLKYATTFYRTDGMALKISYASQVSFYAREWHFFSPDRANEEKFLESIHDTMVILGSLENQMPDPDNDKELHIARPDLHDEVEAALSRTMASMYLFVKNHTTNTKHDSRKTDPVERRNLLDEQSLAHLQTIMLLELDFEQKVNEYLFNEKVPTQNGMRSKKDIDDDRILVKEITSPSLIKPNVTADNILPPKLIEKLKQRNLKVCGKTDDYYFCPFRTDSDAEEALHEDSP